MGRFAASFYHLFSMSTAFQKPILLSPAGSFEALMAAIEAGADAVYFGVEQLNMRTRSSNSFVLEDLLRIVSTCHQHQVRAYITLNTVMYDHDMQLLRRILDEVKRTGVDAVIASDFAVMQYCRERNIPVHISTQANVSNVEALQFFASFSDVVVLARELTLKQVEQINQEICRKNIRGVSGALMQTEIFVHGALCMAVSGKCYLSLHSQNASANRGACVQNCRRPYAITDLESGEQWQVDNEYILSPKDLCTIDILDQVIQTGTRVLKIEGSSKGPEYVHTVTRCYREAIDAVAAGTFSVDKIDGWLKDLSTVYNRGFWEGYYLGRKLGEWTPQPGSQATDKKIYLGKGVRYYPKIQVGEFQLESGQLNASDRILITGPTYGMRKLALDPLMINGSPGAIARKGDRITFSIDVKISDKDKLYKIVSATDAIDCTS